MKPNGIEIRLFIRLLLPQRLSELYLAPSPNASLSDNSSHDFDCWLSNSLGGMKIEQTALES
jgi:hypothetical protein